MEQSAAVAHETACTAAVPGGRVCVVHVDPPSVVATTTALPAVLSVPTATQFDVVGHETPARKTFGSGRWSVLQVAPPSVVATRSFVPDPTAQQSDAVGHETASRTAVPTGRVREIQVVPPSAVEAATAERPKSKPTVTQLEEEPQAMASSNAGPPGTVC
jgi:hypothetical protein